MTEGNTIYRIVDAIRKRVAQGWTKWYYAIDSSKKPIDLTSPDAVCWCLSGAMYRGYYDVYPLTFTCGSPSETLLIRKLIMAKLPSVSSNITSWNDAPERTQADVLAVLDAILADGIASGEWVPT